MSRQAAGKRVGSGKAESSTQRIVIHNPNESDAIKPKGEFGMNRSSAFVKTGDDHGKRQAPGIHRKILAYDSGLMMAHVRFTKGAMGSVHTHPHRQITFVERGSFKVQMAHEKQILRKGDSFIVPPDVEHGVVALEEGDLLDVFTPVREAFPRGW